MLFGGELENFKWDATRYNLNGKVNSTLSITSLTNTTGALTPSPTAKILLKGNSTTFKGNANINIDNKPVFTDVPLVLYLSNGKLVSLIITPAKTNGAFPLPFYGIVTSLTP